MRYVSNDVEERSLGCCTLRSPKHLGPTQRSRSFVFNLRFLRVCQSVASVRSQVLSHFSQFIGGKRAPHVYFTFAS